MDKDKISATAQLIIQHLKHYSLVLFYGEMGAGKTTLIQHIAAHLGCAETVQSPTFSIVNEYFATKIQRKIIHADLFRLKNTEELIDLGFEDYFEDPHNIVFIEWPQIAEPLLPNKKIVLNLKNFSETQRQVELLAYN